MVFLDRIIAGAAVITLDGTRLGTVAEIRGSAFRIQRSHRPQYWLPTECVAFGDEGSLRLAILDRELPRTLLPDPS